MSSDSFFFGLLLWPSRGPRALTVRRRVVDVSWIRVVDVSWKRRGSVVASVDVSWIRVVDVSWKRRGSVVASVDVSWIRVVDVSWKRRGSGMQVSWKWHPSAMEKARQRWRVATGGAWLSSCASRAAPLA